MASWPVVLLFIAAVLLLRWNGDPWVVTVAKLAALTVLALGVVLVLGSLVVWWS